MEIALVGRGQGRHGRGGAAENHRARPTATTLYRSVLTLGELRKGIEVLPEGARNRRLLDWLEVELPELFAGRLLCRSTRKSRIAGAPERPGRPFPAVGSSLAATALTHGLMVVTCNRHDFQHPGLVVIDP